MKRIAAQKKKREKSLLAAIDSIENDIRTLKIEMGDAAEMLVMYQNKVQEIHSNLEKHDNLLECMRAFME